MMMVFDSNKYEYNTSTFGFNAGIGYSLMWNDKVCIEPSFWYCNS